MMRPPAWGRMVTWPSRPSRLRPRSASGSPPARAGARRVGQDGYMAKPPESTKTSLRQRLAARAAERWPQLAGISVRWHGPFAYVRGQLPDGTELPLFRLRYADSASTW